MSLFVKKKKNQWRVNIIQVIVLRKVWQTDWRTDRLTQCNSSTPIFTKWTGSKKRGQKWCPWGKCFVKLPFLLKIEGWVRQISIVPLSRLKGFHFNSVLLVCTASTPEHSVISRDSYLLTNSTQHQYQMQFPFRSLPVQLFCFERFHAKPGFCNLM